MSPEEVLGLRPGASPEACRAAFRRLVRQHHPDVHPEASPEEARQHAAELRRVTKAWATLLAARRTPPPAPAPSNLVRDEDDEQSPFDLDDGTGVDGAVRPPPVGLVVVPMALFALAVVTFSVSAVMSLTALWQLAMALFVLGGLSFVLTPFFVMLRRR